MKTFWGVVAAAVACSAAGGQVLENPVTMSGGQGHMCITDGSSIYCWGENRAGQCGGGSTLDNVPLDNPTKVILPASKINVGIKQISAGLYHTCVLFEDGSMVTFGGNSLEELGVPYDVDAIASEEDLRALKPLDFRDKVKQISCHAGGSSAALLEDGSVHIWGKFCKKFECAKPGAEPLPLDGPASQVDCQSEFCGIVMESGEIYFIGDGRRGRLGSGSSKDVASVAKATNLPFAAPIAPYSIALGPSYACVKDQTGLRCWGDKSKGILGYCPKNHVGDAAKEMETIVDQNRFNGTILQVSTAEAHQCVLLDSGKLKCVGLGDGGRLGYSSTAAGACRTYDVSEYAGLNLSAVAVATTEKSTCALLSNTTTLCFGSEYSTDSKNPIASGTSYLFNLSYGQDPVEVTDEPANPKIDEKTPKPTKTPTQRPTKAPKTSKPTKAPTERPTKAPVTERPTKAPTERPTKAPVTERPTKAPTTGKPTKAPSPRPTKTGQTNKPTGTPTDDPSEAPTKEPSKSPSDSPSEQPTMLPTQRPIRAETDRPTKEPSRRPSKAPSPRPSSAPTLSPSEMLTESPTKSPTTVDPTRSPSKQPSMRPTLAPSLSPSLRPTLEPTSLPTRAPIVPTDAPVAPVIEVRPTRNPTPKPTERDSLPLRPIAMRFGNATFNAQVHTGKRFYNYMESVLKIAFNSPEVIVTDVVPGSVIVFASVRTTEAQVADAQLYLDNISDLTESTSAPFQLGRAEPYTEPDTPSKAYIIPILGLSVVLFLVMIGVFRCCSFSQQRSAPKEEAKKANSTPKEPRSIPASLSFDDDELSEASHIPEIDDDDVDEDGEVLSSLGPPSASDDGSETTQTTDVEASLISLELLLEAMDMNVNHAGSALINPAKRSIQGLILGSRSMLARHPSFSYGSDEEENFQGGEAEQDPLFTTEQVLKLETQLSEVANRISLLMTQDDNLVVGSPEDALRTLILDRAISTSLLEKIRAAEQTLLELDQLDTIYNITQDEYDLVFANRTRSLLRSSVIGTSRVSRSSFLSASFTSDGSASGRESFDSDLESLMYMPQSFREDSAAEILLGSTGLNDKVKVALNSLSQAVLEDFWGGNMQIPFSDLTTNKLIGNGAFGTVVQGVLENSVPVAIKLLGPRERSGMSLEVTGLFIAELERWKRFGRHPNILVLYGSSGDDLRNRVCLVMELCTRSLASHLQQNSAVAGPDLFGRVVCDIANALTYLHSRGIVHREVKPSNILLNVSKSGSVLVAKLSDFGMSTAKKGTILRARIGSMAFMAPEQLKSPAELTTQADIYSLSIVMWQLIEGREAWVDLADDFRLSELVQNGERPEFTERVAAFPPQIKTLVESCWHHTYSQRPRAVHVYHRTLSILPNLPTPRGTPMLDYTIRDNFANVQEPPQRTVEESLDVALV